MNKKTLGAQANQRESKGIHNLLRTRWTERGDALAVFIDNNTESTLTSRLGLMDLWDWSLQVTSDTEMKARLCEIANFCSPVPLIK